MQVRIHRGNQKINPKENIEGGEECKIHRGSMRHYDV